MGKGNDGPISQGIVETPRIQAGNTQPDFDVEHAKSQFSWGRIRSAEGAQAHLLHLKLRTFFQPDPRTTGAVMKGSAVSTESSQSPRQLPESPNLRHLSPSAPQAVAA